MPHNSNFPLPRGHRFFTKNGSYGYGAKSRWGPPRVHLGANGVGSKKWVKAIKNYHALKSNFRLPRGDRFFTKNGSYGYGAKSRWGPPRVHLFSNGVLLGPKNGHRFFPKNGSYLYGAKSRWRHHRVHLWAHGVPLGKKKWVKTVKNYYAPKFEFSIGFSQKMEVTVMAPNHGGDPLGSILGPMGSHWVKKNGSKP